MNSPLKQVRMKHQKTLQEVSAAVDSDTGNLSRIERGLQVPSKEMTEKLVKYFGGQITETQIIYPERFAANDDQSTPSASTDKPQS